MILLEIISLSDIGLFSNYNISWPVPCENIAVKNRKMIVRGKMIRVYFTDSVEYNMRRQKPGFQEKLRRRQAMERESGW